MFDPPVIFAEWAWVLGGYEEVSTARMIGMGGQGPVPFTAIDRYAEREGFSVGEYREFRHLVRELDGEFLTFQAQRAEESSRKAKTATPARGRRG